MSKTKNLKENFPNEGTFSDGKKSPLNPDNYFHGMPLWDVRRKYIRFTVYMEAINKELELQKDASIEQLSQRIYDLVYASQQEENV